ncbi:MAG: signal peptide peptidase SppA [Candidatus Vecturithrix sp.]|jgi:protease-4|nr:signal peptide peptidase SppA [Candidatus Vecturithrix sp.]
MQRFRRQRIWGRIWSKIAKTFRIIKNIFLIILLIVFVVYAGIAGWLYWEFSRLPKIKQESVLVMDIEGFFRDRPSMDPVSERISGELGKTRHVLVSNIRKAAKDPRILGILLDFGSYSMDSMTRDEVRAELLKFKETGKKVFAFTESMDLWSYLFMSVADKIYMPPSGDAYFPGFRYEIPFFKKMFDLIGVQPEFVYIGKYKTAPQIFTDDQLSDAYREVLTGVLDQYYQYYVEEIATARHVSEDTVKQWIDEGIHSGKDALETGIVDGLIYKSHLDRAIQVELGLLKEEPEEQPAETSDLVQEETGEKKEEPELSKVYNGQYARIEMTVPNLYRKGDKIAVIYAQGSITSGRSDLDNEIIGSDSMVELLATLADDEEIKGILLRIDSGGGGARASDLIRNAIYEANQKKPVVISMVGAAASGGYMISAPAASIVAYPMTITGSIGIFGGKFSMQGLLDLIRINVESLDRGKHAGIFSGSRAWTEDEAALFRKSIQQGYDEFLQCVADGRGMTVEAVDAVAQGRIWFGKQAIELGLVDHLGGFDRAVAVLKEELDISQDQDIQLVEYPKMDNPFEQLLKRIRQVPMGASIPQELQRIQHVLEELTRLQNETLFAWFPYRVVEQ